jgi:hypothetical protein
MTPAASALDERLNGLNHASDGVISPLMFIVATL